MHAPPQTATGALHAAAAQVATEAARGAVEGGREVVPPAPVALIAGAMIQALQTAVARLADDPTLPGGLLARALARELVRIAAMARVGGAAARQRRGEAAEGSESEGEGEEELGEELGDGLLAELEAELAERGWVAREAHAAEGRLVGLGGGGGGNSLAAAALSAVLWSLLAQGLVHWEVAHRGAAGAAGGAGAAAEAGAGTFAALPPPLVDQAHWRGLLSLAHLAAVCGAQGATADSGGSGGGSGGSGEALTPAAAEALQALRGLWGNGAAEVRL